MCSHGLRLFFVFLYCFRFAFAGLTRYLYIQDSLHTYMYIQYCFGAICLCTSLTLLLLQGSLSRVKHPILYSFFHGVSPTLHLLTGDTHTHTHTHTHTYAHTHTHTHTHTHAHTHTHTRTHARTHTHARTCRRAGTILGPPG